MDNNTFGNIRMMVFTSLFTALIIVGTYLSVPLPFSPVPIVLANLFIFLAGGILGPKWGAACVGLYLFLGLLGLPVFTKGGSGIAQFAGPTGGFLIGYMLCVIAIGLISGLGKKHPLKDIVAFVIGALLIYIAGTPWLKIVLKVDWQKAFTLAVLPFLIGDAIKIALSVGLVQVLRPIVIKNDKAAVK